MDTRVNDTKFLILMLNLTGGTPEVRSDKSLTLLTFDISFLTFDILHSTNGPMDQWTNGPMDQWTNGPMDLFQPQLRERFDKNDKGSLRRMEKGGGGVI